MYVLFLAIFDKQEVSLSKHLTPYYCMFKNLINFNNMNVLCIKSKFNKPLKIKCFLLQVEELPKMVQDLSIGRRTWDDILNNYPLFEQQEATKDK